MDELRCEGCGRAFMTANGAAMMKAIVGGCPDCGANFTLTPA